MLPTNHGFDEFFSNSGAARQQLTIDEAMAKMADAAAGAS